MVGEEIAVAAWRGAGLVLVAADDAFFATVQHDKLGWPATEMWASPMFLPMIDMMRAVYRRGGVLARYFEYGELRGFFIAARFPDGDEVRTCWYPVASSAPEPRRSARLRGRVASAPRPAPSPKRVRRGARRAGPSER